MNAFLLNSKSAKLFIFVPSIHYMKVLANTTKHEINTIPNLEEKYIVVSTHNLIVTGNYLGNKILLEIQIVSNPLKMSPDRNTDCTDLENHWELKTQSNIKNKILWNTSTRSHLKLLLIH